MNNIGKEKNAQLRRSGMFIAAEAINIPPLTGLTTRSREAVRTSLAAKLMGFPIGWVILWFLLALSLWSSVADAQTVTQAATVSPSPRLYFSTSPLVERVAEY